ncbi:MAG TPA: hypothetical protein PLV87_10080 [Opitutaceae bacterium]|nr:hypothetical protein [Opitutaceae bacterium]
MKISSREEIIQALPAELEIAAETNTARGDMVVFRFPAPSERLFLDISLPQWLSIDRSAPAVEEVISQLFGVLKRLGVQINDLREWLYSQSMTAIDRCISGDTFGNVIVASSRSDNGAISFHCKFL